MKNRYVFLRFPGYRRKVVTLSYDDGVRSDVRLINILNEYGLKCTFNLNSGLFAKNECELRLAEKEVKKLYENSGHEIAVHGFKHLSLADVSEDVATLDVIKDRENLEKMFGKIIKGMAYANGSFDDKTIDILRNCGIKYARTCVSSHSFDIPDEWLALSPTCHHNDPELFNLAEKFLDSRDNGYFWANAPMMFYLWGHSYEFDQHENWNVIENFAKKIGGRSDIWYATNGEIYDYVKSFEKLEFSTDGAIIYNPTVTDVYLCYYRKNILVKSGEALKVDI